MSAQNSAAESAAASSLAPATGSDVVVRFCPSPTGTPHVGLIRTCLFNWAYARHVGGTFVFRIEDTDSARDSEESYRQLLEALAWLGLDWDQGVEVGGPHEPYRQSARMDIYAQILKELHDGGYVYESYSTPEEIEARHRAAGRDPKMGYDGFDRDLSEEQIAVFKAEGRAPVLRMRMPEHDVMFTDAVRGEVTFKPGSVPDYVVARAGGQPLYTLTNPVDDALMGITHVLRGEDLLSSTPRQVVMWQALVELGHAARVPVFGHLPYVMGQGNKKLSKRDPESSLFVLRDRGFIREGLLNYLSLLGWAIAEDRDIFTVEELVAAFDVADVNANPARFDIKKAEAINAEHIRLLEPADFEQRLVPYLQSGGVLPEELTDRQREILREAAPLVQTRIQLLSEATGMMSFLFIDDADLIVEEDALAAVTKLESSAQVLQRSVEVLSELADFSADSIDAALRGAIVEGLELKPKFAFTPLRVGVSGRRVSPPLWESMEILGKASTVSRLQALLALVQNSSN